MQGVRIACLLPEDMSRDTTRGDTNDLILLSKELQRQLEDRRDANVKVSQLAHQDA